MTELQTFLAMLNRAGIGYGMRDDFNPPGTGVMVHHGDDDRRITEWWFDEAGELKDATTTYEVDGE